MARPATGRTSGASPRPFRGPSLRTRVAVAGALAALVCAPLLVAPAPAGVAARLSTGSPAQAGQAAAASTASTATDAAAARVSRLAARGNPRSYSFMGTAGDAVARWNPCRPIGYRVNTRLGGRGALRDTREAIARIRKANGLRFSYQGPTRIVPGGAGGGRYPADTQLVIAWARPSQSSYLKRRGVAGMGGPSWSGAVNERGDYDLMIVRGFAVLNANLDLGRGFSGGVHKGYYGTRGQLLMHEIGHAVGLGHAEHDEWQIMYPMMTGKRAVWGAGDLRGLRRLGSARGCLSAARSFRTVGGATPTQTEALS